MRRARRKRPPRSARTVAAPGWIALALSLVAASQPLVGAAARGVEAPNPGRGPDAPSPGRGPDAPNPGRGPEGEYEVKAAFLYQFTSFVTWPEDAFEDEESPFVIGVLGDDPFDGELKDAVRGKRFQRRSIEVKVFEELEDLETCQMLFVTEDLHDELDDLLEALGSAPTLLVGESDGFAADGGTINFYFLRKKTKFEINPEAAKRARLKLSSKLLDLARIVKDRRGEGDE